MKFCRGKLSIQSFPLEQFYDPRNGGIRHRRISLTGFLRALGDPIFIFNHFEPPNC